jgi:malonyl-CoA/methylmalonyl-CoA synthetase
MLSHRNLASNALTLVDYWGFTADDVLYHALPIYHVHGLFVASHCVLLSGSRMWFCAKFDVKEARALLPKSSVMMGVPTFYTRLLADPHFGPDD